MTEHTHQEFGRLRSWFFPVHKSEFKLFLPLIVMFFFICFNYNLLRAAKDSLVVTAPASGAEIIPFIKVWVILPMALLMTLLFTRLANKYTTEKVFYIMMGIFLGFFVLFSTILFPLRDVLHPHHFADHMATLLPAGFKGFIALFRNWTYTTFYVMSELWSTMIMSVLFWGFANEILNVKTAKRFYVLILIGGNISAICAGGASTFISELSSRWSTSQDPWQYSLLFVSSIVVCGGLIIVSVFRWLNHRVLKNPAYKQHYNTSSSEVKMSLRENFQYLAKSKYLLCIATIVLTYNICINLTEVTWKDQLLNVCPLPNDFNSYMGKVTMWVGIVATLISLSTTILIRRVSWTFTAMIPPFLLMITGVGFFSFLIFKHSPFGLALGAFLGTTPLALGILFGSIQQVVSRASKYTIFDATKEIAFIPLSRESKLKGKAAIDGVGSRLGKSGSALIYQTLLVILGTVSDTVPYVGVILMAVIGAWMFAVYFLGKKFQALTSQNETVTTPIPQEATT